MRSLILEPAGMTRSSFEQPPSRRGNTDRADGHDALGVAIAGGAHIYPELAAAGLWSTPSDYARFIVALQNAWSGSPGALLSPASARAMTTPVLADYGLGLIVLERSGRTLITHTGTNEGFACRFVAYLDGIRQGVVVMTNGDNGGALAAAIQRTLVDAYQWDHAVGPPVSAAPES